MKSILQTACILMAMVVLCSTASFASVVDQSQLTFNTGFPFDFGFYPNYPVGQSFTAGMSGVLSRVDVFSNGPNCIPACSGVMTMEIRDGDGVGGTLLGTANQAYTGPNSYDGGLGGYLVSVDVEYLGLSLTSGNQYTFAFTNVTGGSDYLGYWFANRGIIANNQNPYLGGRAYSGPGYGEFVAPWDLMFQTNMASDGGTVPEPASIVLLSAGLVGLLALKKRK